MPKQKKILIIEDDEAICSMYQAKFEQEGVEALSAATGAEGLEMAKKEKPNLIMLDVILPGLDGFSVLKKLKANSATKKIPVIMLTNLGTEEDKEKGEKMGADSYLVKASLTPSQISEIGKKYLNKN
jgi:DNA-binding response OmpR family regulator